MARSQVFSSDTTLYHPIEGARVFPAGETDPGAAWSDSPGGDRSEKSMPSVMQDLIDANDRADGLGVKLDAMASDMARTAQEATEAKTALEYAQQAALAAQEAQKTAEEAAAAYMSERDEARAAVEAANAKIATLQAEADKVEGLASQLATANQTIADLNDKVTELGAAKPPKPAKAAAEAPPEAEPAAEPAADAASAPEAT